ncbi:unnamed protein product [Fraxinus pennsylvanica]|uniref:Uncharacterized protein n=1 Tax=Fraxinus pennsylvanica TaxID=56036 RepID=A0AAD2DKN0_9LAMI|nr:unnamed protein product [Fraxinus pennsylvanica]
MFGHTHKIPINPQPAATGSKSNIIFIPQFDCFAVNGVLCPEPISWVQPNQTPAEMEMEEQARASFAEERKGNRKRTKSEVVNVEMMTFQLFKSPIMDKECYILQMYKMESKNITNYLLSVYEENGKKEVKVESRSTGEIDSEPITEEISINLHNELSLQERLVGWTFKAKKRQSSNLTDKYFIHGHGKAKKTFRSVKEFGNFILFHTTLEGSSHRGKAKMIGKEQQEASLAEANENPASRHEIVVPRCDEDNVGEGKEQQEASLAEQNQNPASIHEIVVPRSDEDNVGEGDEDGIFSEILKSSITEL